MSPDERPLALHVATRLILGGPTRPIGATLAALERRGFRTALAAGRAEAGEVEDLPVGAPPVRLSSLRRAPSPWFDPPALLALTRLVRRLRPAIVHTHTAKAGALGRLAARLAGSGAATVHTFHGHSMGRAASGRAAPLWTACERALAAGATDLALAVSPGQRDELARLVPRLEGRLRTVPLPLDLTAYPPLGADDAWDLGRRTRPAAPDGVSLAFVGRGVPVKGLDFLARAGTRLGARNRRAAERLTIVVAGPVAPEVARAIDDERRAGSGPQWLFLGPLPNPLPVIAAAGGIVLPSWSEGTPVAVLEALALGRPVLASAVGGVPELLAADWRREGPGEWRATPAPPRGLLLPPGHVEAWAEALERFVLGPRRIPGDPVERRGFAQRVFDPRGRGDDVAALYRDLLKKKEPRPR